MKPERWQKIDRIFQSALEYTPAERAAFINEACGGDDSLRREVELLLSAEDQAGSFLNAPAYAVAAELLVENGNPFIAGKIHQPLSNHFAVGQRRDGRGLSSA
ncbi:MAG: hypothetical protein HYR56_27895 [Acidobacteria bacterium]|nr:hypothetical protein [Acidobacteriota bacterium]MBI3425248.1 hypothetical protein [Acidobacteriota bacterium]